MREAKVVEVKAVMILEAAYGPTADGPWETRTHTAVTCENYPDPTQWSAGVASGFSRPEQKFWRWRCVAYVPAEQTGREAAERWIPFDSEDDGRCPINGLPVQFAALDSVSVGYRNGDGSWYDSLNIGQDGTPNDDIRDEQVTHWAPLLSAPPKGEAAK